MKKFFLALIASILIGCGGGGASDASQSIPIYAPPTFPALTSVRTDLPNLTEGSTQNPLKIDDTLCRYLPYVDWQTWLCERHIKLPTTYTSSNSFNFAADPYKTWIIAMNNEFIQNPGCNTGPPNQSRAVNTGPFYLSAEPAQLVINVNTLFFHECVDKLPYMSASYLRGAQKGDTMTHLMSWEETSKVKLFLDFEHYRASNDLAWNMMYIHYKDLNTGLRYMVLYEFVTPFDYLTPYYLNWNWPFENSFQYPGAKIVIVPVKAAESIKSGSHNISLDLNAIALSGFPEFAVLKPALLGVEFGVEMGGKQEVVMKIKKVEFK